MRDWFNQEKWDEAQNEDRVLCFGGMQRWLTNAQTCLTWPKHAIFELFKNCLWSPMTNSFDWTRSASFLEMMVLCESRRQSQPERMTSQGPGNAEALMESILLGLLHQSAHKDPDPCMTVMIQQLGLQMLQVFKDDFKTKRAAHDALYHAFACPTLAA
jgi:hypothetical protein